MAIRSDNSLYFSTGLDNSGLRQGTFDALGIVQSFVGKISKINPFLALSATAIAAFAVISAEAYSMAKDFEHAMKEVETISDATQKNFKGISADVFALSKISPDNPEQLAKAYYEIVSAGYDGAKGLNLLEVSAKAAVAGVTDTKTAADGLTTILNAFKIEASQSEVVADALFNTVKLGKTNFSQLASNISQVAPIAAASNIPLNEVLSTIASLTKQGVPTSVAMTQVRSAIVGLNESGRLDGTKTLQENMQGLYDAMNGNQTTIQKEVGRIEAVQAILGVSGKNAKSATEDLLTYNETIGATEKAFKGMSGSTQNEWAILTNRMKALTYGMGQAMVETSNSVAKSLNELIEAEKDVTSVFVEEGVELDKLKLKLQDSGIPLKERKKIISDLQIKYPSYLSNIENEGILTHELSLGLANVNDQLVRKARLAVNQEEISEQADKRDKAKLKQQKANDNLRAEIEKVRSGTDFFKRNAVKKGDLLTQIRSLEQLAGDINAPILRTVHIAQAQVRGAGREYLEAKDKLNQLLGVQEEIKQSMTSNGVGSKGDDDTAIPKTKKTSYTSNFKEKENQYKDYNRAILNQDLELANQLKANYSLKESNYIEFLRKQYEATEDAFKKSRILEELDSQGKGLTDRSVPKIEIDNKPLPLLIKPTIDSSDYIKSLNQLNKELDNLQKQFFASNSELDKDSISKRIENKKNEIKIAKKSTNAEKELYGDVVRSLDDLRNKDLRAYIKNWKEKLKTAEKGSAIAIELEGKINSAQSQIGANFQNVTSQISSSLQDISSLFTKFGDEDTAKLLDQLAGVAEGIGQAAAGFASGNPADIIGGIVKTLDSAITIEVSSDTAKFEKAIKELEKTIEKLDYVISKSLGGDKISNRKDAIKDLEELQEQTEKAKKAEEDARKEVKVLGFGVGKKGKGSGTDSDKIEELEKKAEEARRKVEELKNELNELYTGTSQQTIVDSILQGIKEGKTSIKDFADTFEDLMKGALLESFKLKYLDKQLDAWFESFGSKSSDGLSSEDINSLSDELDNVLSNAQEGISAMDDILNNAGLGSIGDDSSKPGLSGAISTITEDTANVLAGTLNSIRIDVANGLNIAEQSMNHLNQIAQNTSYNHYLESMNTRLQNIETLLE